MDIIEKYKEKYSGVYNGSSNAALVDSVLTKYRIDNEIYRSWLIETDGGPIKSEWFDSVSELENSQVKLASEPWTLTGFVVGWDGAGNPICILENGSVVTEDHNFGGIHVLASSFEMLLSEGVSS